MNQPTQMPDPSPKPVPGSMPGPSGFWSRPLHDYQRLLLQALANQSAARLSILILTAVFGWWIYVPVHELLHAFGCLWTGGEVTRLEISPVYGAAVLKHWFDWIAVGSDYAGQLTGFDTHGNDGIYLVTVLLPYVLSVFPGMWLFRRAVAGDWSQWRNWALTGFSLAMVTAPFVSVFGDMYEAASIVISRAVNWLQPGLELERWRSDDFFLLVTQLSPDWRWSDIFGLLASLILSVTLCWSIYNIGCYLAKLSQTPDANTPSHRATD